MAQRVAAGAAWLDANLPDWEARIDLERLDLSEAKLCILGQLFGDYGNKASRNARFSDKGLESGNRGFNTYSGGYEPLTAEWRHLIEARRAA